MNKGKKVLVMSMTGGFGHIRAGQALLDYAKQNLPHLEVEHVDIVNIDKSLKKYSNLYDVASRKFPFVWEMIYRYQIIFFILKKIISIRRIHNHAIENYVSEKKPDAIIFTNAIILSMFADTYKKKFPNMKMGIVVTDYHGHPFYHFSYIDHYFVPTIQVQNELEQMGIKPEKIVVTGIPINPKFYIKENIASLKLKYGIKNKLPVVLFIASFKASKSDILSAVEQLLALEPNINLIFIANGNEHFYAIAKDRFLDHERFLLVKWTNAIEEYMKLSSVIISKAGGLTVSECIVLQKPLVMVNPIPGQEEHNAKFVEKNNFGVKVNDISEVSSVVPDMILASKNKKVNLLAEQNPCEKIFQIMAL